MVVVKQFTEVSPEHVEIEGATHVRKRLLLGSPDHVPHFSTRMFEVEANGNTPYHNHDFEHEIYVLEGEGRLRTEDKEHELKSGTVAYVPSMDMHQIINTGVGLLRFLCIVPKQYE